MTDIIKNTMDEQTKPENRLRAIRLYCLGVREDFPITTTWVNNILILAGFKEDIDQIEQ